MRKDSKKDRTVHTSPREALLTSTSFQEKMKNIDLPEYAKKTPELEEAYRMMFAAGTENPDMVTGTTARFYGPKEL